MPLLLVAVQFALLGAILVTGPVVAESPFWLGVEAAGLALGAWAIWSMRWGNFNITHVPRPSGRLVSSGPYRWIRHPMYAALLLATLALVLDRPSPPRWLAWGLLCLILSLKLAVEERALLKRRPEYEEYRARTRRLVPWVF